MKNFNLFEMFSRKEGRTMLGKSKIWFLFVTMALVATCGISFAEEAGPPDSNRPPVVRYNVAAPRVALVGPAKVAGKSCKQWAGAENFARDNGQITIAAGTRLVIGITRNSEYVWYENTMGKMGTILIVQKRVRIPGAPQDGNDPPAFKWVKLGRDTASAVRRGPSIARPRVAVPVRLRPGRHVLRAIIRSSARPHCPPPPPNQQAAKGQRNSQGQPRPAEDKDVVYIKVRVVNLAPSQIVFEEEPTLDPDALYIIPIED